MATREIQVSYLVVGAKNDQVETVESLEILPIIRKSQSDVVKGWGHLIPMEELLVLQSLVSDFRNVKRSWLVCSSHPNLNDLTLNESGV